METEKTLGKQHAFVKYTRSAIKGELGGGGGGDPFWHNHYHYQ